VRKDERYTTQNKNKIFALFTHDVLIHRHWYMFATMNDGNANPMQARYVLTAHERDYVRRNRSQSRSKGLQLYWHQSEGIRPPFNRVDSVLLELPYDGLIDWDWLIDGSFFLSFTPPHCATILTILYCTIASQTNSHRTKNLPLEWPS
jgi:hypothetical protein